MNSVKEIAKEYNLTIKKYKKIGKVHVITTCEGTYCFKPKDSFLTYLIGLIKMMNLMR